LVTVAVFVALALPTTIVPKSMLAGVIEATAGACVTVVATAWDTSSVWPPIVRFAERAEPVFAATV
jgi:hypothetical protein